MKVQIKGTVTRYSKTGKATSRKVELKVKHVATEQRQPAKRKPRKAS